MRFRGGYLLKGEYATVKTSREEIVEEGRLPQMEERGQSERAASQYHLLLISAETFRTRDFKPMLCIRRIRNFNCC